MQSLRNYRIVSGKNKFIKKDRKPFGVDHIAVGYLCHQSHSCQCSSDYVVYNSLRVQGHVSLGTDPPPTDVQPNTAIFMRITPKQGKISSKSLEPLCLLIKTHSLNSDILGTSLRGIHKIYNAFVPFHTISASNHCSWVMPASFTRINLSQFSFSQGIKF